MLQEKIQQDLITAMKNRDEAKLSVLRMLQAAIKNKKIDLQKELTDDDVLGVAQTLVKQYNDSIEDFKKGNRDDLVKKTEAEVAVLSGYLPEKMPAEEVKEIVKAKIAELGASGPSDFGKVMGIVMKELGNKTDGNTVSAIVKDLLSTI